MHDLPDNSVDVVFADPPFNLGKKYKNSKDLLIEKDYLDWSELWLAECVRVTKDTGSIFIMNIPKHLISYGNILNNFAVFKHWISWDSPTSPMGKSLQPAHYGVLYFIKTINNKFYELR